MTIPDTFCHTLDHKSFPIDLFDDGQAPYLTLSHTKHIFGHGVGGLEGFELYSELLEPLIKSQMAFPTNRLRAIGDCTQRGQIHAFDVAVTDLLCAEVVGKV